jgi:hypothetical protein
MITLEPELHGHGCEGHINSTAPLTRIWDRMIATSTDGPIRMPTLSRYMCAPMEGPEDPPAEPRREGEESPLEERGPLLRERRALPDGRLLLLYSWRGPGADE